MMKKTIAALRQKEAPMGIVYDPTQRTLTLHTKHTTYQMHIDRHGLLLHLYYGAKVEGEDLSRLLMPMDLGFSPNINESRYDRTHSPDSLPQEYTGCNTGDFRLSCVEPVDERGIPAADLRYVSHRVEPGVCAIPGLPCAYDESGKAETLIITLADKHIGLSAELFYTVFPHTDAICRHVRLSNASASPIRLEKAASLCLDLPAGDWELLHFPGRYGMERQQERMPLPRGIHTLGSRRGASSHSENPAFFLCQPHTTEEQGACYAVLPIYSGSWSAELERHHRGGVRIVTGIQPEGFCWQLEPGARFDTPQVLLTCSPDGLAGLTHRCHDFLRTHLIPSRWAAAPRPVLINNWEATYFRFNTDKLVSIAKQAAALGVDLLVLDDGWFGKREDDNSGLGDWFVNERKLPGGLGELIRQVNALGMQFGLWVEPEMVSEDSDLYRAHPDWALTIPGRPPVYSRNQLVLDFSHPEVVDCLYERLSALLRAHPIRYVKWDMNRNLTDLYSRALPPHRQGELSHRYMLGVYDLLARLTAAFPEVRIEGCSGGGGRFDAGMLAYCPQIWCSDNTDAISRLSIQEGTLAVYPASCVGAHVSACPNHQTGRTVPMATRAEVAMAGTFGYELDPQRLTEQEREQIRNQIIRFRRESRLIQQGDYYRLSTPSDGYTAWEFAAKDGGEALVSLVSTYLEPNILPAVLKLKGLRPEGRYEVTFTLRAGTIPEHLKERFAHPLQASGAGLMRAGYALPPLYGEWPCVSLHLRRIDTE